MNFSESDIQQLCVTWARYQYPNELFFAVPNGVAFYGTPEQKAKQMNRLKKEGLLKGVSDLIFFHKTKKPLFVEMKSAKGNQSDKQKDFEVKADLVGNYIIIDCLADFQVLINNYYKK